MITNKLHQMPETPKFLEFYENINAVKRELDRNIIDLYDLWEISQFSVSVIGSMIQLKFAVNDSIFYEKKYQIDL